MKKIILGIAILFPYIGLCLLGVYMLKLTDEVSAITDEYAGLAAQIQQKAEKNAPSSYDTSLRLSVFELASNDLLNVTNQYYLNENTTCEDIIKRLQRTASVVAFTGSENWYDTLIDDSKSKELVKNNLQGLIEANKDNDANIKSLEHIQYCLTK